MYDGHLAETKAISFLIFAGVFRGEQIGQRFTIPYSIHRNIDAIFRLWADYVSRSHTNPNCNLCRMQQFFMGYPVGYFRIFFSPIASMLVINCPV